MVEHAHFRLSKYIESDHLALRVIFLRAGGHAKLQFHDHDFSELSIVISGHAYHLDGNSSCRIEAGDILLQRPGDIHTYRDALSMELINIIFDARRLPIPLMDAAGLSLIQTLFSMTPTKCSNLLPILHLKGQEMRSVVDYCNKLQRELNSVQAGRNCCSLLLFGELLLYLARQKDCNLKNRHRNVLMDDVVSFINKNVKLRLSVAKLAEKARMSQRSFFRHFKNATGYNPNEYLGMARLKYAEDQLLFSNKSVSCIAIESGYYDSSDFCRKFKKHYKVAPYCFRKQKNGVGGF